MNRGERPTPAVGVGVPLRRHHLLVAVPAIGMLTGVPFANSVHRVVLGLPFLALWILCWVLATAVIMGAVYRMDTRTPAPSMPDEGRSR